MKLIPSQTALITGAMLKVTVEADSTACDTGYISDIPLAVFSGSPNVYSQFCDEVDGYHGHQPVSWTVDTSGGLLHDTTELNQQPSDMPVERSPPPLLSDYTIDLAYNPTRKGVSCTPHSSCADTFATIGSTCGRNGQTGDLMTYQGSSGSGCGLYTYFIAPPPNRISVRRCYPLDYFGEHHMKVQPWALDKTIREFVCKPDRPRIQASDNSTWMLNTLFRINWVPYLFQVYWKQGCYQRAMDADFDFPIEGRPQVNCTSLLWNDFTQCSQNDGVGGNITVGCVVYEYKTLDQRVHGSRRSQVESPEHKTYDAQGVYDRSPEVMTYR